MEYRGELRPIATTVPGVSVSELFPRTARQAGHCCIVRSVSHADRVHTSAGYTMLTGAIHPQADGPGSAKIKPGPHDQPHLGSLLAMTHPSPRGLPVFASLPEAIKDAGVNPYPGLDGGLLGNKVAPWRIEADASQTGFRLPDMALPPDMTAERLADRGLLLPALDRSMSAGESAADKDHWQRQAFALLRSQNLREAFRLERETERTRADYGRHLFGQGCLLVRRLLEAGIALVSVYWHHEGPDDSPVWDTHQNNFRHLRKRLAPPTDRPWQPWSATWPNAGCSKIRWSSAWASSAAVQGSTSGPAGITGPPCNRSCWPVPAFPEAASTDLPIGSGPTRAVSPSLPPTSRPPSCTCWE